MADDADIAQDYQERMNQEAIDRIRADIPKGSPGDCDTCGEWSGRLVKGMCSPCRDRFGLG